MTTFTRRHARAGIGLVPVLASILVACGGEPVPPAAPPAPTEAPAAPIATATAAPTAEAAPPAPTASASAAAEAPPPKQSSGRPAVLKSDPAEITDTFGSSPGAKLQLGDKDIATLRIPEFALRTTTNITFKIPKSGKANGAQVGRIYQVTPTVPPSSAPTTVESDGPPFELALPAGRNKEANLAIGTIQTDDKGHEKITWEVIAPKRIDDVSNTAYFELTKLPDGYLHVTTKKPTEAKK